MRDKTFGRMSIRLSSDMLSRLSDYTKQAGATSVSAAVQFILLSFLNQPERYPVTKANELDLPQNRRTSFSLSTQSLNDLAMQADCRGISKAECLRLALYYTLYI